MAPELGHSTLARATAIRRLTNYWIAFLFIGLFTGCVCERTRDDIKRQEVVEGGNVTLTCYAQPTKLKAYRWVYIRAGTKRPQVLSSGRRLVVGEPRMSLMTKMEHDQVALELTLTDVRPYESGLFMCWRQGQKPDPQVLLIVLGPGTSPEKQVIRRADGPSEVKYGDTATFTCIITPAWPVKVTWFKNGEAIPVEDRLYTQNVEKTNEPSGDGQIQEDMLLATLIVTSIRRDSVFTCRIDSNPPDQRAMPVEVLVPKVESLTTEPDKDLVEYGQPLAITCVVSGTDAEILWLKDGAKLAFDSATDGREIYSSSEEENRFGSTIYIQSMSFRDNGHYVCYIPGASRNILINIEGREPRLLGVTGGDFFEDDTLSLRCTMQYLKNSQHGDFRWQFQQIPLDTGLYDFRKYQAEYNVTVHELTIQRAGPRNAGTYECITPYGSASIDVNMFVAPSLGEPLPSEVRVREGDTLQISCKAVGSPPPAITWERKIGDGWVAVENSDGLVIIANGELQVPAASLGDSGDYRCAAQSEAGSFLADVVVTVIHSGPEVFDIIAPQNIIVGDNFTVQCTVINWDGEVDFTFHDSSISSLSDTRYQVHSYPSGNDMTQVYLTIHEATLADAGPYSCHVGSHASSSIVVEVHERPAEIIDLFSSPAVIGRDFFITCIVLNGPEKVTFYNNGSPIPEVENSRYSIQSASSALEEKTHILKVAMARPDDGGIYECALGDFDKSRLEVVLEDAKDEVVSVEATPAIMGRDFNVTCIVKDWDDEVTFIHNNVVVDSAKDWRYDVSTYTSEVSDLMIVHDLMVSGVTEQDEGTYECYTTPLTYRSTVVSVWNLASVKLELQARDRPNWRDSPIPVNCLVEGVDPDTVTILFSHFDEPQVSIKNRTKMATSDHLVNIAITENEDVGSSPSTTFTLGFYSLSTDMTGVWSCEVMLPSGHILGQDTLFLEIEEPPEFVEKIPEQIFVDSDQDLMLNCSARGSPDIFVSWHSAGIPEPIERRRQSATLFIPGFTSMDAGDYYCSATLLDREIRAKTKLVLRTPQPRVESVSSPPTSRGKDIVVTCTVSHWKGQVLFLHNGNSVDPIQNPRYVTRQRSHGRREPSTITHTLVVKESTPQDSGIVECFISFEVFGSTNVTVTGEDDHTLPPDPTKPTIAPGRVVELRGPDLVRVGETLTLTCLVSPVVQQDVFLVHDVFLLYAGGMVLSQDSRLQIVSDAGSDGSKNVYLTIREVTTEDTGEYQCTTSTDPPAVAVREVLVVPFDGPGEVVTSIPDVMNCSAYTTCTECVTTPVPCRWCMDSHRCVHEVEEECSEDAVVSGQDEGFTQTRSGPNYCPVIMRDPPEILIPNGEDRSTYLDSKNVGEERTFDNAKFFCRFNIEDREITVMGRLWYSYIYCGEINFQYFSQSPTLRVPLQILWDGTKVMDNPDDIHVTVYSCELMAQNCTQCQALSEKYKCGWCSDKGTCEYEGRCPAADWIQPRDECYQDPAPGSEMMLYGPVEMELSVQPSDKAVLPCSAGVAFDLDAGFWDQTYTIKWTREIDGVVELISENNLLDVSSYDRPRFFLDTYMADEALTLEVTKYDLVIDPMQVGDIGLYRCSLSNNNKNMTVSKTIYLSSAEAPQYDRCQLPAHWTGEWYATYDDYTISGNYFGNTVCEESLGNKYLLRNEDYDCNMCFIIEEKHPNILQYRESTCLNERDLNTLCSLVDDFNLTILKRKNAVTQCPFSGRRIFTYSTQTETCRELPSTLISERNNTELVFWYQPCDGNQDDIYYSNKVQCVATWKDDWGSYLMGKLEKLPNRAERYRCFTYEEAEGQEYRYVMSETGTEVCGEIGEVDTEKTYEVYDNAIAPGPPTIDGFSSTIQVTEGYPLQLKCSSYGGLPLPTMRWLQNGQEVVSTKNQHEDRSEAILNIDVRASDEGDEYTCEVTNAATSTPLSVSTVLSFSKDSCELPSNWEDRWYQINNRRYVDITRNEFSNNPCISSLGHNYLLHNVRKDCNRCVVISERHPNVLEYRRSKCKPTEDLNVLCSEVSEEDYLLVRPDSRTRCPWVGARSFSFQTSFGGCSEKPSQMYSKANDTEIQLFYNPCPEQTNPNIVPYPERLRCIADWRDDDSNEHYFIGEEPNWHSAKADSYRCFTYIREEDGRQVYRARRVVGAKCGSLTSGGDSDYTYKINGLSEAPSAPVIEGYSPSDLVQVGDLLQMTCVTYGGFPTPKIEWFRNEDKLESDTFSRNGRHEAGYRLQVAESDKSAHFQCKVSNFVTKPELTANFTLSFEEEDISKLLEPRETHLAVFPSERVILNCTALLSMEIAQYWDLPYRMRWVHYGEEEQTSLSDMHILEHSDSRYSLEVKNRPEDDLTHYNLIIDPVRVSDEGIFECIMWDDSHSFSHQVQLSVSGTPEYESCEFPDHWNAEWYGLYEDYEITNNNNISGRVCEHSFGNRYLLRNEYLECNECFVINEKHPNLLQVKESTCSEEEDLAALCSSIDYEWRWMIKKGAVTECPFTGVRPFAHQGSCDSRPSKLYADDGDTEMIFVYNTCSKQASSSSSSPLFYSSHSSSSSSSSDGNTTPARRVECLATWTEGTSNHLMGRWDNVPYLAEEQFRCYTYAENEEEDYVYLSHSGSSSCGPVDVERAYKVFREATAPGKPKIEGYDPTQHKEVGATIDLLCVSEGGFPLATLRWFTGDQELPKEDQRDAVSSKARLKIKVKEEDIEYRCEASNMAATEPLVSRIVVSSIRGIVKIMRQQVMAVEGQNVFLPCARLLDQDLQLDWYDVDLDMILTSGNQTLGNNDSLTYDANYIPYLKGDLFGLVIESGFLDTKYGCSVDNQSVGNTTLVILPAFMVAGNEYDVSDYFEETETVVDVRSNEAVALNCTLKAGIDPVVVSWRRHPNDQLLTQDDINLAKDEGYDLEVEGQSYLLEIPRADADHSTMYVCQVILSDSEAYENNFTLSVQDAIKGNLGSESRIPCNTPRRYPVSFIYKDTILNPETADSAKYSWEYEEVPDRDGNLTILVVSDTSEEDGGVYSCVDANNTDEILQQIILGFASEEMLNVTNVRVLEVTGSVVSLAWDPPKEDPFASIEAYEILCFKREDGDEKDEITVMVKDETRTLLFLDEDEEYGFQVRVKTAMGWGAFSETVYQRTGTDSEIDKTSEATTTEATTATPSTTTTTTTTTTTATTTTTTTTTTEASISEGISSTSSPTEFYTDLEELEKQSETPEEEYEFHDTEDEVKEEEDLDYYDYEDEDALTEEEKKEEEEEVPKTIYKRVVLPCHTDADPDDITWKRGEKVLFLGPLDLTGHTGLSVTMDGSLVLNEGPLRHVREDAHYTCYGFNSDTFEDTAAGTYHVSLRGDETVLKINGVEVDEDSPPEIQLDIGEKFAVLANSKRVGNKIVDVLKVAGLKVRLLDIPKCNATDIQGWENAEKALQECEAFARSSGQLKDEESIFMGMDFFVELSTSSWFAVTQLYLNNVEKDISVNVFAPMVPVPANSIIMPSSSGEPVRIEVTDEWWNTVQGVDKSSGSGLTASILSMQESYLTQLEDKSSSSLSSSSSSSS